MENRSHALIAGLFTLVLVLAAAVALWWFSGTREQTHTYLLETRGSVTGLNVESQVRYRGIRAGKVRDIRPDPADPGKLLVEITLGRQYPLTERTVARLNQQGITGLAYVMLEDGATDAAGRGTPLAVDGTARLTIQPGMFDKLGDKAGDVAEQVALLSRRLNALLDERNLQNLSRTLDNLASASEGMKELPQILAALRGALSDANLGRLQAILAHLEQTAGAAAPLTAEARSLVVTMNSLAQKLDSAAGSATSVGERLQADTLPRAEVLMHEITAATRRLDRLLDTLNDTPQAVLFGTTPARPGPGEGGFVAPPSRKEN